MHHGQFPKATDCSTSRFCKQMQPHPHLKVKGLRFSELDFFFSPAITRAAGRAQAGRGRQRQGPGGNTLLVEDMPTWQNGHVAVRNEVFQAAGARLRRMGAACLHKSEGRRNGF